MIREEEIINAARTRAKRHQIAEMELYGGDKCNYSYGRIYNSEIASFKAGAEWADKHPKNVWHSADEEPECRDGGILCEHDLYYWVATKPYLFTIYGNWHNKVKREHLIRWAYIRDLLPKGGEG